MRSAVALVLLMSASVAVLGPASAQRAPTTGSASASATPQAATPAPAPSAAASAPAAAITPPKCTNPNALGVSRTVEVDTTGGPGFGGEHFKQHDFLRNKEVVLTFDDGPWPTSTAVLKALADECVRATFFPIGKHATYYPEILKAMYEAGHTIGSHTWSHKNLEAIKDPAEQKAEIEKGISAVSMSAGVPMAPFFRFPALRHPPAMVTYIGERNLGIFSTDMDSFDFKMRKPEQVVSSVMAKLKKHRQGHRPDARLPDGDVARGPRSPRAAQGRRLQDRAHARQGSGEAARRNTTRWSRRSRSSRRSAHARPRA